MKWQWGTVLSPWKIFSEWHSPLISSWLISLTISSLGQVSRFKLISQMTNLTVGHGQPAGALFQIPLQTEKLPLHSACLTSEMRGLSLQREKHNSSNDNNYSDCNPQKGTSITTRMLRNTLMNRQETSKCTGSRCISVVVSWISSAMQSSLACAGNRA